MHISLLRISLQDGSIIEDSKLAPLSLLGAVVQSTLIAKKHSRTKMEKIKVEEDSISAVDEGECSQWEVW